MNTNKNLLFLFFLLLFFGCNTQKEEIFNVAHIETNFGKISIALANETPIHRDNFIKLANDGFYEDILFHRVIEKFVIQAGDKASIGLPVGQDLPKSETAPEMISNEIDSTLHHVRGAVGMARTSDDVNPMRNSSATQFYIVCGGNDGEIDLNTIKDSSRGNDAIANAYMKEGGAAHLDFAYTVFGFVVEGIEVVDNISHQPTGGHHNRPIGDIKIKKVKIEKVKKSKLEDLDIFKLFYADTDRIE